MSLRRFGPLSLALAALLAGCHDVSQRPVKTPVVIAVFGQTDPVDATNGTLLPTPNDLAMQATPSFPASAQKNLLQSFVDAGGFPADQAPTLTVPIRAYTWDDATGKYVADTVLPQVDPATLTAETAALYKVDVDPPVRIDLEPALSQLDGQINLVPVADESGSRRLAAGRYVFAVRGGDSGAKLKDTGTPIAADVALALTIPNVDLSIPSNQPPGGLSAAQVTQLETTRALLWNPVKWISIGGLWAPCLPPVFAPNPLPTACTTAPVPVTSAYAVIDGAFPHAEAASVAAFEIAAPTGATLPAVDAVSGEAPLPIDLLRTGPVDPSTEENTIAYNPAFGPAAHGLTTLSGFSTTAMILAQVITPGSAISAIDASTVNGATVLLYQLTDGGPELLPELKQQIALFQAGQGGNPFAAKYVAEPTPIIVPQGTSCPIAGGCSQVIGLQPGVGAPVPGLGTIYLPPLDESTSYAVVVTTGVKDLAGNALARPTIMTLLTDPNSLVKENGSSAVGGVDDATATALQKMKTELGPVFEALPSGTTTDDVVLAYTFKTQSITKTALDIAAIPYGTGAAAVQGTPTYLSPSDVATQFGFPLAAAAPAVKEVAEVKLNTTSLLINSDAAHGGAFDPANAAPEVITALVALPAVTGAATATCPTGRGFTATHCAPLVVFRHGITRSKADVLAVAGALTSQGFIVAAIDGEKHGDRSWCTANSQCATGSTCNFKANLTGPTDVDSTGAPIPIGFCESAPGVRGNYLSYKVTCADTSDPSCVVPKGIPFISGNLLVSINFFRTRDSLRQDVIDQSALVKALAPLTASTDDFAAHLRTDYDLEIDPTKVYWLSQSLGSSQGGVDIAANPRFTRSVFSVPGATLVDIFGNPESTYHQTLLDLIAPVQAGTAAYLQLLQVAKWILDPADPANFNRYVLDPTLTSPTGIPFPARQVLQQNALCDNRIPNAQNAYFASQLVGPTSVPVPGAAGNSRVQWYMTGATGATCPDNAATHGFLFDLANPSLTTKAQTTAVGFLLNPTDVPSTVRP